MIAMIDDWIPRVLPHPWTRQPDIAPGAPVFERGGLRVIASCQTERDGKRWLHVSASRQHRCPTWEELREIKDIFIGRDRLAIQVLPRASEYVNCHPYALHLWHCFDGDPTPDFRNAYGLI